ncbi:MAG: methyltransferase [Ornithinibacter sp.]|nr:methyltransferase [Ornithinibacter sp.]
MAPVSDASVGVDLHPSGDAAELSAAPGGRATLVAADATTWQDGTFEAVIAVGVAHVFGGPGRTLDAVRRHLAPGGRVLLGDGIWDTPPTAPALRALDATAEDFHDPEGLSSLVRKHGYEPVHGHVSTLEEWDEYEVVVDRLAHRLGAGTGSGSRRPGAGARRCGRAPRPSGPRRRRWRGVE